MPFEADAARSLSPAHDDAHTPTMQGLADGMWASAPTPAAANAHATPSAEQATAAPKGKEKAAKGPLNLLDLPMDILKEIIHQVSRPRTCTRTC